MPRRRPAPAPSVSQTMTGKVKNSTGQALNGAIARTDSAPARQAMAARFQPQDRMIATPAARHLSDIFTASPPHHRRAGSCCHWLGQGLPLDGGSRAVFAAEVV